MPPQENIAAMQHAWARLRVKDLDGYLALYSDTVIHHGYSSRIRPGVRGLREHYTSLLKGFPDLHVEVDDIMTEGEKVAHRFTFYGTHRGEFLGLTPTGKSISSDGIQMNLFSGGKCTEVWSVHDSYRFLSQIGAVSRLREKAQSELPKIARGAGVR
jgi:predicted ester cyclase